MELGVCPVIISDNWIPPEGPNWEDFAIFVKEKDISKIHSILETRKSDALKMGKKAQEIYQEYFQEEVVSERIHLMLNDLILTRNERKEKLIYTIFPLIEIYKNLLTTAKSQIKKLVLLIFLYLKKLGIGFPYKLNRSIEVQLGKGDD